MTVPLAQQMRPFYLDTPAGRIFCLYYPPQNPPAGAKGSSVLYLPPLAEEMNRCRVMVATQARSLALRGIGVLLLDYFGTGDSGGDFADTHWQIWKQNAQRAIAWLAQQGQELYALWGIRLGALLATELAHEQPELCAKLLLWQPISNGNTYLTQVLRMRMAAQMDRGEAVEKTDALRERFAAGEGIEIGGYVFSGALACDIDGKQLTDYSPRIETHWFEQVRNAEAELPLASQKVVDQLKTQGVPLEVHKFTGEAFWQLHERASAPMLIEQTTGVLST